MKNNLMTILVTASMLTLSSCYVNTMTVGNGAQGKSELSQKNTYFIYGLAPGNISDPNTMAGGASDYTVTIKHTFVDGLLGALTFGIYTPTTTIVTK